MGIIYKNNHEVVDYLNRVPASVFLKSIKIQTKEKDKSLRQRHVNIMIEEPTSSALHSMMDSSCSNGHIRRSATSSCYELNLNEDKSDEKEVKERTEQNHPPGTQPGGTWLKQIYAADHTSVLSTAACCFVGPLAQMAVSCVGLESRYIYYSEGEFYDIAGEVVNASFGRLHIIPNELSHSIMDTANSSPEANTAQASPGFDTSIDNAISNSTSPPKNSSPLSVTAKSPPGTKPGGLWYRQKLSNGQKRFVYQPEPRDRSIFYNKKGQLINPRSGTLQPPLSYLVPKI